MSDRIDTIMSMSCWLKVFPRQRRSPLDAAFPFEDVPVPGSDNEVPRTAIAKKWREGNTTNCKLTNIHSQKLDTHRNLTLTINV